MTTVDRSPARTAPLFAAAVACALGLATISPVPVGAFWDDAVYVILGKALATGEGYRYIHLPGEPSATLYPPLWPALLSTVWRVAPEFPENVRLMKLLNPLLLGVAAAAITRLATRVTRVNAWIAAAAVLVCLLTTPMLMVASGLMSEPLALALAACALLTTTAAVYRGRMRDGVVAGALVALAVLARAASLPLVAGLATGLLWSRSRRACASGLAIALAPLALWFWWSAAHVSELPPAIAGSYGPYTHWVLGAYRDDPGLIVAVVRTNVATIVRELGIVVFGPLPPAIRPGLAGLLIVMTGAGVAMAGRRTAPLAMTLATYGALIVIWPYNPGRFVWAFLPLASVALISALGAARHRWRHHPLARRSVVAGVAFAGLAGVTLAVGDVRGLQRRAHANAIERNAEAVLAPLSWIEQSLAPTDTIATDLHLYVWLYLKRAAVPLSSLTAREYLHAKTPGEMRAEMMDVQRAYAPSWLVASGGSPQSAVLREWWSAEPARFGRVGALPAGGAAAEVRR